MHSTSPVAGEQEIGTPPGPLSELVLSVAPVPNNPDFLVADDELLSLPQPAIPRAVTLAEKTVR